jgi:hypothetical protein
VESYTEEDVLTALREKIKAEGRQAIVAKQLGFTPQFLNDVVNGRRTITGRLALSLGFIEQPRSFVKGKVKA